jgi:hypothetical protein
MYRALARLIVTAALLCGGIYTWKHFSQAPAVKLAEEQALEPAPEPKPKLPEEELPEGFATIRGPLADYVAKQKPSENEAPRSASYKPSAEDHIEDSPVGTTTEILHKTFPVAHIMQLPFEIPPHAANPHFHGTFRSFTRQGGAPSNDQSANVDMLLMNDQQFAELVGGHEPDVLFIADTSHYQDINFDLPPSMRLPVKYHIVFRNSPGGASKKLVQADFSVDF